MINDQAWSNLIVYSSREKMCKLSSRVYHYITKKARQSCIPFLFEI
jgi:hypothetical protein